MSNITRKSFLKKTAIGIAGVGFLGHINAYVFGKKPGHFKMQYRKLGRTGLRVSILAMGASRTMEPSIIRAAYEHGINFFDTGRVYARGKNEEMIGKTLEDVREQVIYQSKMKVNIEKYNDHAGLYRSLEDSMHASLRALRTDYIDTMLLHGIDDAAVLRNETVVEFLEEAKKSGKIRFAGFSSHRNMAELVGYNNKSLFYDLVMVPFNHKGSYRHSLTGSFNTWDQAAMIEKLKLSNERNIGMVTMKTTSAGPFAPDDQTEASYSAALKWTLDHDFVHTMAVGMGNFTEISENLKILEG